MLEVRIGIGLKRAVLAAALLLAASAIAGCATGSYAGIPLAAGAADPELQSLASRARAGDKQAQLELGIRYEAGRGIPPDRKKAERLYRSAALTTGGVRMAYVPAVGGKGRAATVPISSGPLVPGLPEAKARLAALQGGKPVAVTTVAADGGFLPKDRPPLGRSDLTDEIFTTIIRVELFSDACFDIAGQTEDMEIYARRVWACVLQKDLPSDCTQSADAVLRAVRFVRFNGNFILLQRSAVGLLERCVSGPRRSMSEVYSGRQWANFLDLVIANDGHATEDQKRLLERYEASSEAHAPRHPPILPFAEAMCRKLTTGTLPEPLAFWLLFCNSENLYFTIHAERERLIDETVVGKGINGWEK